MPANLLEIARAHREAGRPAEAIQTCQQLLRQDSHNIGAVQLLGLACLDAGRVNEAVSILEKTADALPGSAQARFDHGLALQSAGRPADAADAFRRSLALDPSDPDHWCRLAVVLRRIQDWPGAAGAYRHALHLDPASTEASLGLGAVLIEQEHWDEAVAQFRQFLEGHPDHPEALFGLGSALKGAEKFAEAVSPLQRAVALRPHFLEALFKLGSTLQALERRDEAVAVFRAALEIAPRSPEVLTNLGNALWSARDFAAALDMHERSLRLRPEHAATYNNIGNALLGMLRYDEAEAAFRHSLSLKSEPTTLCNLGNVQLAQNRTEAALDFYRQAQVSDPGFKQAVFNEALVHLLRGDLRAGLPGYELRWILRQRSFPRETPVEQWQGRESLEGKTILVCCEQGFGDTLQFVRYVPLLQARGARVILRAQKALLGLLSCLPGVTLASADDPTLPPFDFYCLLLSLPLAFGTELATIPAPVPYLTAAPDKAALWRDRLVRYPGLKVGLVCSGNTAHRNDYNRSLPLHLLAELTNMAGVNLFLLQKEIRPGDQETLARRPRIVSLAPEIGDFGDTAAIIANLDLVISVDTSVAHLAGALGRPTWILLPFAPDWRWLLDRSDSPWYPTVRLFRQPAPAHWEPVLDAVARELKALRPAAATV